MDMTPHAWLTIPHYGQGGGMVFDLGDEKERQWFLEEIVDGGHFDDADPSRADDGTPWLVVEIRPMPAGYSKTLPEFEGW